MPKFRYTGKDPVKLAQVGDIVPGEVIEVSDDLAKGLKVHGADEFTPVKSDTKVGPPEDVTPPTPPVTPPAGDPKA